MKRLHTRTISRVKRLVPAALICALGFGCATTVVSTQKTIDQAAEQIQSGDLDSAFRTLETQIQTTPSDMPVSNYYRTAIRKHGKEERSIAFFRKLVEAGNAPDELMFAAAFAYIDKIARVGPMGAGFLSKRSIALFRKVLDEKPNSWVANFGVGMNYLHWPDYFEKTGDALIYFEKCLELQEKDSVAPYFLLTYLRLGDAYVRNDRIEDAHKIWQRGLTVFPGHADLKARLKKNPKQLKRAVLALYNPNQSIGEIDTDISVLWATDVPERLVPLDSQFANGRTGGQLAGARRKVSKGEIGLFSWFMRNLPFLSDPRFYSRVDMSQVGIGAAGENTPLASRIAHGMIMGFMSALEGHDAATVMEKSATIDPYLRPFYHEGLGMGLAAAVMTETPDSLVSLEAMLAKLPKTYRRLYLAGAGMWFGLDSGYQPDFVQTVFAQLGASGAAYANEGYGFARALFHSRRNPEVLRAGEEAPPLAAQCFYHGVGRAFWILNGTAWDRFEDALAQLPTAYQNDARSGYGMGLSFTKIDDVKTTMQVVSGIENNRKHQVALMTGIAMGYTIRYIAEPEYVKTVFAEGKQQETCFRTRLLGVGQTMLTEVEDKGGEYHANWRARIQRMLSADQTDASNRSCG